MHSEKWIEEIVISGDIITSKVDDHQEREGKAKLGPGLRYKDGQVVAVKSGILKHTNPNLYWVDYHQKRYVPVKNDHVIGVITGRLGDFYKVDIGAADNAVLNNLSFEGASKRNLPNLNTGDIIYGKLVVAHRDVEPEISCVDKSNGKAKGMGKICSGEEKKGMLFRISTNHARKVLSNECVLLDELSKLVSYECTIGMNGWCHLVCHNENQVISIMDTIVASELMDNEGIKRMLEFKE